jgi:hypothetical protein
VDETPTTWIARIESGNADSIHVLRYLPDVSIAEHAGEIWIRGQGPPPPELSGVRFRSLQQLLNETQLAPLESRIPDSRLPDLSWSPISSLTKPEFPPGGLPTKSSSSCPIRLVRSTEFIESTLLQTDLDSFTVWVSAAPEIRLKPLRFACSDQGQVLVHGSPIPSISGERFAVYADAIACPAGFSWDPPVQPAVLGKLFNLNSGDLAIFRPTGEADVIPEANFIPVTRSAVRLTAQGRGALDRPDSSA